MARRSWIGVTVMTGFALAAAVPAAYAQPPAIEIAPFGGFRFGSALVEAYNGQPIDVDGAPAVGLIVDVPLPNGMQLEGAFSHQRASLFVPGDLFSPGVDLHVSVDHWQGGALQEFGYWSRAKPFLTGLFGLTRYGSGGDNDIRFTTGAGGGVKLFPTAHAHVGVRLEGRVFATFVDADGTGLACGSSRGCIVHLHVDIAWQAEFTAALVVKLPNR